MILLVIALSLKYMYSTLRGQKIWIFLMTILQRCKSICFFQQVVKTFVFSEYFHTSVDKIMKIIMKERLFWILNGECLIVKLCGLALVRLYHEHWVFYTFCVWLCVQWFPTNEAWYPWAIWKSKFWNLNKKTFGLDKFEAKFTIFIGL